MTKQISGERIFKEIRRMDKSLKPDDPVFVDAAVLLDSAIVGPNPDKIAAHLRLPRRVVREVGARARSTGLWAGRTIQASDWWAKDGTGGIAFWLDVNILRGLMKRI